MRQPESNFLSVFNTDNYLLACTSHIWKTGVTKNLSAHSARESRLVPPTLKIAALPLHQYHLHTKVAAVTMAT